MNRSLLMFIFLFWILQLWGQKAKIAELQYISPKPGSKFIMPENNIAFRNGQPFDPKSLSSSLLEVKNAAGNKIEGKLKLSTDQKTLIYKPYAPFPLDEIIHVELKNGLKTISDLNIQTVQFEFTITNKIVQPPERFYQECIKQDTIKLSGKVKNTKNSENNLPDGFPNININISNNPSIEEYYFFAPWTYNFSTNPFLIISDAYGTPIYYRKADATVRDLKVQHNGKLSFAMYDQQFKSVIMDSAFRFVDYYQIGNGYTQTDPHDFQLLDNGHAFVLGVDWQQYAMDTVVPGGNPNALVCGFIVQEQDIDKNVIFQWRSWDHFLITDAGPQIDLTEYLVDYVHGNAVEVESDTSILISSRSLDEITKIHRNTGEIIWRFGGKKNQFNVQNDTLGFTMQHDCRRLQNDHITLFDNGAMSPEPKFSSALEYELDEINLDAVLIRRLRNDPDIYGNAMGNAQWKNDQSVIVGWGNGVPGITEFSPEGEVNMEIEFQGVSYRAFRFPWKTTYFLLDADTLQYGYIWHQNALTRELNVYNGAGKTIELTSYYSRGDAFTIENEFPVSIPQDESINLQVKFSPDSVGLFNDVITINSDINSDTLVQRISQQVYLVGNAISGQSINHNNERPVLIYPNPTDKYLVIEFSEERFSGIIQLYNILGDIVREEEFDKRQKIELYLSHLPIGIYFVNLIDQYNTDNMLYKIVKY